MVTAAVLVYDGDCGVCTRAAAWFSRRFDAGAEAVQWQRVDLGALGLTEQQASEAVQFVRPGSQPGASPVIHSGADAFSHALRSCRAPWPALGHLVGAPGVIHLARRIYPVIARNRHRLPGSSAACEL